MKIDILDLVKACNGSMRKVVQLDDMIENLNFHKIIEREEYDKIQREFLKQLEECYGTKFVDKFYDVCNSSKYIENL